MIARKKRPAARHDSLLQSLPSWDDVRFFLAMHRAGSLSAAAPLLQVTQPTCGRRLLALEKSLGLRLFDRTPEGLSLTAEGTSLLDAATAMERSAQELALRATLREADLDGLVRIATTELIATSFLVGALPEVRAKYPGIGVELVISNAETDLLRREADFAMRFRPEGYRPTPESLIAQKISHEPFKLYGAESYLERRGLPADPSVLAAHDVVVYSGGRYPGYDWFERASKGATVSLAVPSMHVAAVGIANGLGLGILPMRAARMHPQLRAISPVITRGVGWIVVHPDLRNVPRIRVVIDMVVALFRAGQPRE